MPPDFQNPPLEDMVALGAVRPRGVRLWLRLARPEPVEVEWWPEGREGERARGRLAPPEDPADDGTLAVELPGELGGAPLAPRTRHRFRVTRGAETLVEAGFETAPVGPADGPDRVAIGLLSCHQPFDDEGRIAPHAEPMLRAAIEVLERHDAKLVLTVGDQCYTDWPKSLSLLDDEHFASVAPPGRARLTDCTREEVRALVQRRYRHFWNVPAWRELHLRFPCLPMLDDHELVDNWGSDPAHGHPPWRAVGLGARAAYEDYQALRVEPRGDALPDDFDFTVEHGMLAVHAVDLRSNRSADGDGRMISPTQLERVKSFLRDHAELPAVALVFSVPLVHLPRGVARLMARVTADGEDFSDRWSSDAHAADRDSMLRAIHEHQRAHPEQRVVLLSGDIHIGAAHELRWHGEDFVFHQLISSGITHLPGWPTRILSGLSIRANRRIRTLEDDLQADVHLLRGARGNATGRNPYLNLNLGLLELEREGARWHTRLLLYGPGGRCVFRSDLV